MMTRFYKETWSARNRKRPPDKIRDGQSLSCLSREEQSEKLESPKKLSKNLDNRLKQQEDCFDETEIKRCYGGEENEEKSDPTKDEFLLSFTQSLSSSWSLPSKDTEKLNQLILKRDELPEKACQEKTQDAVPHMDNRVAELLDNKLQTVIENTTVQVSENKSKENNWDKETYYFTTVRFVEPEQKSKQELNNLSSYPNELAELKSKAENERSAQCVVMCMSTDGLAESNYLGQYSRENQLTWNIDPLDLQEKNLQKQISNIFLSLKNEISPLAAEEGIDEQTLNNTLTTLWKKLQSSLSPQQFAKVMDAIEMKKGGKRLPSFLDYFNLLSKGDDLDWGESGKMHKKEEWRMNLPDSKVDTGSGDEEKKDLPEKERKIDDFTDTEDADFLQINDKPAVKEEFKLKSNIEEKDVETTQKEETESGTAFPKEHAAVHDKEEGVGKDPGSDVEEPQVKVVETVNQCPLLEEVALQEHFDECEMNETDGPLSKEHALDKELTENMELDVYEKEIDDGYPSSLDETCKDMHSEILPIMAVGGKIEQVFRPFCSDHPLHGTHEMETNWGYESEMVDDTAVGSRQNGDELDQEKNLCKPKRNIFSESLSDPEHEDTNGLENNVFFDNTKEIVDVRVKYFRVKSCMDSGGQGGGNSSSGETGSNAGGRSFNRNGREKDGRGSEDGSSGNHNNNDRDGDLPGRDNSLTQPRNQMIDTNIPGQDYKAVRKKHSQITDEQLFDLLGSLSPDSSPNIQEDPGSLDDVNHCLLILFHAHPNNSDVSCSVCSVLHSLLIHFAGCQQPYKKCHICWQLLRIGLYHVQKCIKSGKETKESASDVCYQLLKAADFQTEIDDVKSERLWMKMKKYVGSVFHPPALNSSEPQGLFSLVEKEEFTGLPTSSIASANQSSGSSLSSAGSAQIGRSPYQGSAVPSSLNGSFFRSGSIKKFQTSLTSIPESPFKAKGPLRQSGKRRSRRRLSRQSSNESTGTKGSFELTGSKSDEGSLPEGAKVRVPELQSQSSIGELTNEGFLSLPNPTEPSSSRSSFGALDDISLTTSMSSASGQNEEGAGQTAEEIIYTVYKPMMDRNEHVYDRSGKAGYSQDPYETQKTYGPVGVMSLPIRANIALDRDQLLSLETAPTGEPGIGEVVYGTRRQIMKVAQYWAHIRGHMEQESYKHQIREEGVILDSAKKYLRILRTRYQKKSQWMRLVHLGNGVAGKCHLAHDTTSDFKFCVKRIHIAKYEENELMTWSDLDHTNIVKLYGAIRHGCKIYIFCEFIAGGSLTSLINEQRSLNRRLSHWMCLRYFKQLLQVLVYLKSHNVLHEDLKADNILIKRNTTLIAVTDFGLARRMNVDSEMKGMCPTGSQTQWSPEKATSNGHGFAADVWAAVCILVHMLSGYPPWTKRYPGLQMLHFVIFTQSPPLADVPNNIQDVLRDLITQGFTVDPTLRPSASDLLRHEAFKILDQGAPESYYSTLISSGQAIPNNLLSNSDKGPQEMEEILNTLSASSSDPLQESHSNRTKSLKSEDKHNAGCSLPETSLETGSVIYQRLGTDNRDGIHDRDQKNGISGEASSSNLPIGSPGEPFEEASGAVGGEKQKDEQGNSLQSHYGNLPFFLCSPLISGAEGGHDLCSGYDTSPDSFEDPYECVDRFLNDDLSIQSFSHAPQQLKLYQPDVKCLSIKTSEENCGEAPEEYNYPRWSLLLGDQTYSGIEFVDETSTDLAQHSGGGNEGVSEINTEQVLPPAVEARDMNTSGHSSRESSVGVQISSPIGSHHSRGHQSPAATSDPDYISPAEMQTCQEGISNPLDERCSPIARTTPEDPFPTSIYPPSNLFEEQIDSGDLFGDPTQQMGHSSSILGQSPLKGRDSSQISSLETHNSSGVHKSSSSSSKSVCFEDELEHKDPQMIHGSPTSDIHQYSKPRSASAPSVSVLNQGTPDNAIEPGKNGKECPIYSKSIDLPDDIQVGGILQLRETDQEEEKTLEKKNPGLTLDVNLTTPKKNPSYQRNQSTPAGTRTRTATDIPHPKTCPGAIESLKNLNVSRKAEGSSGIGTSLCGEVRHSSSRSSDTSGIWTPEKGRHSSAEMSPSTPKSQFDHQEREFSALEKASQSDVSASEQELAMGELQESDDVQFNLGPTEPDSFENQLASIQKQIPDEHEDLGHKYRLMRDDNTPLSPIRVPAKYEEWREVIDLIRSVVTHQGFEHFTLKHADDVPVDYNAPLTKGDLDIKVCVVQEDLMRDHDGNNNCWCEQHEDQLRAMA